MITNERIGKYLSSLRSHANTTARGNQKYRSPIVFTNDKNANAETTDKTIKTGAMNPLSDKRYVNIYNTDQYRFNGRWYNYHYSINKPEEIFGILAVDDFPVSILVTRTNKKSFIGRIDRLVFQNIIHPFMLFIDGEFVNWDNIELIYDCGDIWLTIRGIKYNYYALQSKNISIIIMPFKCEYLGEESDILFDFNYKALNDYLQSTLEIDGDNIYIYSPTLETEHKYNNAMVNVGGWLYSQIKRFKLGVLSEERINKLRYITLYKYTYDQNGVISDSMAMRYNALDRDVPTNDELYYSLCHNTLNDYELYAQLKFDCDGHLCNNGDYKFIIMDNNARVYCNTYNNTKIINDLSQVNTTLFRENYLVFDNGIFIYNYPIIDSVNNITLLDNIDEHAICIIAIYDEIKDLVITNCDKFNRSYINEQAKAYLSNIYNIIRRSMNKLTDAAMPFILSNYTKNKEGVDALELASSVIYKNIDANNLNGDHTFIPNLTDMIVSLTIHKDPYKFISNAIVPLDFSFSINKTYDRNIRDAVSDIVNYDPALLNPVYHKYIDSVVIYGNDANKALIYEFMYESNRGLKIPRKKYGDHEAYFMIFLNGELYENYHKTIVYANFFFIPIDENFQFTDTDRIEILYFKNVNNNEIRFGMTDWLVSRLASSDQDPNFYNISVFKPYIRSKELQIFSHYPSDILMYKSLIREASEDIAFNVSYRDNNNNLCIRKDTLNSIARDNSDVANAFVATSKHKFVYQRLYVDQKAYRIVLDKRFRYCDNQRQYLLFINGRRMNQDSFLVTIPKHTRPFNGMYLYTARFVTPEDRIELFYLPYPMNELNLNNGISKANINSNGYFEYDRADIDAPLSKDLYLFFVNGKKIPSTDIIDIDSHTIKITTNTNTLRYPSITAINTDTIPEVVDYLHDKNKLCKYDSLIDFIKKTSDDPYDDLNQLFGNYTQMTDNEDDKVWANVAKIAILNEIVRDFWVTSGYDYQNQLFVYDYEKDELYEKADNGTLTLPALDANSSINIRKNDIDFLYFYTNPKNLLFEIGSYAHSIKFEWEYSQRLNQDWFIISQSINGVDIPVNNREYELVQDFHNEIKEFIFKTNAGQQYLSKTIKLQFVNGTYWGVIDEDSLEHYGVQDANQISENNNLNISYYYNESQLPNLIKTLDKHLISSNNIELSNYAIGNNNYFVFACPKRLLLKENGDEFVEFYFPNPYDKNIVNNCNSNMTSPIYTDGKFDNKTRLMRKIYKISMINMGECLFTNDYGYTETYMVWKTNGYFTRLFDNFGIDIHIKIGDSSTIVTKYLSNGDELHSEPVEHLNSNHYIRNTEDKSNATTAQHNEPYLTKVKDADDEAAQSNTDNTALIGDGAINSDEFNNMLKDGIFLI